MVADLPLLKPVTVGQCRLPNRVVMAPMTRCRADANRCATAMTAEYYRQRASAGLIITEGSQVSPQGQGYLNTPGIYSEEQVAAWKVVTDAVHARGGHIFLQLWHVGRVSHPLFQPGEALPVAPSAIAPQEQIYTSQGMRDFVMPRALELNEIPGIVEDFRNGAINAIAAGFDGVEIHAANGYLIDQFLRDGSNQRSDIYGGSVENRARLLLEIAEAVSEVWDSDRVGVRLSPLQPANSMSDTNPEATFSYAVEYLNRLNLAYLHINEMGKAQPGAAGPAFDLGKLRKIWKGTYILNCGYTRDSANAAITAGAADLIAFGVPYIANPDLVERFAGNAELNAADPNTFYGGDTHGYLDYPALATSAA